MLIDEEKKFKWKKKNFLILNTDFNFMKPSLNWDLFLTRLKPPLGGFDIELAINHIRSINLN